MLTTLLDYFRSSKTSEPRKCEDKAASSLDEDCKSSTSITVASKYAQTGGGNKDSNADDDDEDEEHPRCDWNTIDCIPISLYEELVSHTCTFSGPLKPAKYLDYRKGTFNAASIVGVMKNGKLDQFIVRVPGHATAEHWTAQDAYMLQREVEMIEYIRMNTSAPVPQVCTYSINFNNTLGHPFIMMTHLPGESAYSIWFDDYDNGLSAYNFRLGDLPMHTIEKKRINFLRSLAKIMAEINTLYFDKIGVPAIYMDGSSAPSIGPLYQWDNSGSDYSIEREILMTTQDYVWARPESLSLPDPVVSGNKAHTFVLGARKLLDMIFAQPVFNEFPDQETFTLHHSDLDLQNILVDSEGNVTGIIDWDSCAAVPRCVGAASAPLFLQKDWMPAYLNNLDTAPHLGFTTHRYRQIYAAALAEYGCADAKYTSKSAMYQASMIALYERDHGDVNDFLAKVLRCIPEFRGNVKEIIQAFGTGWPAGELVVERHLKQIFEPEMPDPNLLVEKDVEIAAMDWMLGFEFKTVENDADFAAMDWMTGFEYETEVDC